MPKNIQIQIEICDSCQNICKQLYVSMYCHICYIYSTCDLLENIITNNNYDYIKGVQICQSSLSQIELLSGISDNLTKYRAFPNIYQIDPNAEIIEMSLIELLYIKKNDNFLTDKYKIFFTDCIYKNIYKDYFHNTNDFTMSDDTPDIPEYEIIEKENKIIDLDNYLNNDTKNYIKYMQNIIIQCKHILY